MSINKFPSGNQTPSRPEYQPDAQINPDYDPPYPTQDQARHSPMSRTMSQVQTPPQNPRQYDSQLQSRHASNTANAVVQSRYASNTANAVDVNQSLPGSPDQDEPMYVQSADAGVPSPGSNIISDGTKRKLSNFVEAVTDDIRNRIGTEMMDNIAVSNEARESNIASGVPGTPQANVNTTSIDNNGGYYPSPGPHSRNSAGPDPRMSMMYNGEVSPAQMRSQTSGQFIGNSMNGAVPPLTLMNSAGQGIVPYSRNSISPNGIPIPGEANPQTVAQASAGPISGRVTQRNSFTPDVSPTSVPGSRPYASNSMSPNLGPISRNSLTNNTGPVPVQMSDNAAMVQRTSQVNNIIREASKVLSESQAVLQEMGPQIAGKKNSVSIAPDGKLFRLSEERPMSTRDDLQLQAKKVTLNINEIVAKTDGKKLYLEIPLDAEGRVVAAFTPAMDTPGTRWKTSSCLETTSQRRKCNKPCCSVRREQSAENTQSNECYDPCSGESNLTGEYTDSYSARNSKSLNTASEGYTSGDECGCSNSKTLCRKKNKEGTKSPREHISQTYVPSSCRDCTPKRDSCANVCCCQSCADSTESSDGCISEYSTECVEVSCSNDLPPGTVVSTKRKITRKCVQFRAGNSEECVGESGSPV